MHWILSYIDMVHMHSFQSKYYHYRKIYIGGASIPECGKHDNVMMQNIGHVFNFVNKVIHDQS